MKKSKKKDINYLVSYWYRGVHSGIENRVVKASSKQEAYDIFGKLSSGTVIAITPMDD